MSQNQNRILRQYRQMVRLPFGSWLFARLVCFTSPYFASIRPKFEYLEPGRCVVSMKKRRSVHNHIKTVHALAMGNLCELAAGLMMEVTIPVTHRWIPKGMSIVYLRKAETSVRATAHLPREEWTEKTDVLVPVSVTDAQSNEVVRATITMYVSPKPGKT